MKIKIHNDGKNKPQSFEASIDILKTTKYIVGLGINKEQSIIELKRQVTHLINELNSIDWNNSTAG